MAWKWQNLPKGTCIVCGAKIEDVLVRLGSTKCHDHMEGGAR